MATWKLSSSGWRLGVPTVVTATGGFIGLIGLAKFSDDGNSSYFPWAALVFLSIALVVIMVALDFVAVRAAPKNRRKYGWVNAVLGSDGRVSTSKTQMFLWTVAIVAALLYLAGIVIFRVGHDQGILDKTDWNDYLILLGGPFAAGILAKLAVMTKLDNGTIQKSLTEAASTSASGGEAAAPGTPAAAGGVVAAEGEVAPGAVPGGGAPAAQAPKAADAITNDSGELDLVDTQYLVFNLVALIYVVGLFISRIIDKNEDVALKYSLPNVPPVLLGLTSAAAATYVANKAVQKSSPRIASLNPLTPAPGALTEILGVNLAPAGADPATVAQSTSILLTAGAQSFVLAPAPGTTPSATKVSFMMAPLPTGTAISIKVITAGGVATEPYATTVG